MEDNKEADKKFEFVDQEESILRFWHENGIFQKTLENRKDSPKFKFFEGPPSANAKPGIHHVLARVYKDVICRFQTMNGYFVLRKAGWDTHGLPIEIQVEKALGFKNKDDIEKIGVAEFNKKCKAAVFEYKEAWEKLTERIGFWLDMKDPYITYDPYYMESEWQILKQIWDKGLLFKDYKVVPYCPRCGTPLSSHEVAQGYESVSDPSLYLKFKLKGRNEYLLVWTTTPWTLISNLAVAVNPDLEYTKYDIGGEVYYAYRLPEAKTEEAKELGKVRGQDLIGLEYEPLYDQRDFLKNPENLYKTWPANFVSADDGSGMVHIAPYGEDDMLLAKKFNIPLIPSVDEKGNFISDWSMPGEAKGKFVKDADLVIFNDLKNRNLILEGDLKGTVHDYPFCWRCHSPLIYYPYETWFIKMSALRDKILANNEKINWVPAYIKEGRFGEWLRDIRDWALSRKRYWGTPLNIWICDNCNEQSAIGSLEELRDKAVGQTEFYYLRHGEADHNVLDYNSCYPENKPTHLTETGKKQVNGLSLEIKKLGIDVIISSDLDRTRETAEILSKVLGIPVTYDERLRETDYGELNGLAKKEYEDLFKDYAERFEKSAPNGETLNQVYQRTARALLDAQEKYPNKKILIISHGDPIWSLKVILSGRRYHYFKNHEGYPELAGLGKLDFVLSFNPDGELDLHRPYIDKVVLKCPKCNGQMKRVPDLIDGWFDSGSMPFSQWHWPFENSDMVDGGLHYPADYICEGVDQTRGWFYTLLAISTLLDKEPAFKNVISLGLINDEKGEKMSKSKGNIIEPHMMIEKYGVDSLRWYLYTMSAAGETKNFSEKDLVTCQRRFLATLYNVFVFYNTYGQLGVNSNISLDNLKLKILDKWVLAKWSTAKSQVTDNLNNYQVTEAARLLDLFLDDLSRWYIRRSRRLFQKPESNDELELISNVLHKVLKEFIQLLAPFCPFTSDLIWLKLKNDSDEISVHLSNWPEIDAQFQNEELLAKMEVIRDLANQALALRQKAQIKVRQPLQKLIIKDKKLETWDKDLMDVLKDEINVKEIAFDDAISEPLVLDINITPELKKEGVLRDIVRSHQEIRQELGCLPGEKIEVGINATGALKDLILENRDWLAKEINASKIQDGLIAGAISKEINTDLGAFISSVSKI